VRADKFIVKFRAVIFAVFGLMQVLVAQTVATLVPTPAALAFTWQQGAALPSGKALTVKSASSAAAFTVTISPGTALWLSASPESGALPASLTARVNPSGLPVGSYSANVRVAVSGFTTLDVPITLTVAAPLPTLTVSVPTLDFVTPPNPPADQTVTLNTTGGPIAFTAAPQGAAWMNVTPKSGVVLPGIPTVLTVSADSSTLTPQSAAYTGKLVIGASGVPTANKTQNVAVSLLVNALTPTIGSLWPSAVLANTGPLTLTIRGTGFFKGTTAKVTGQATPLKTTFISATTMLADLPGSMIAVAGTLPVVVTNPAPGGDSSASSFTVSSTPVIQAIVSAASYGAGAVSPGELVTLFGFGIGPSTSASMNVTSGFADTSLQSTTVAIDGKAAPMIYVSRDQITVQVPYDVALGAAKTVAVTNGSVVSAGTVATASVAPGLFTLDGSGIGQAAALTFSQQSGNYAVNGASAPARAGDIVLLYLTGEGDYATAITTRTGYIVPSTLSPLPQVTPTPTVMMGGAPAVVQYAGPMVGGILGLLQINAVVPDTATKGVAVPVTVDIGGNTSQAGVTLVIK
jgi:uncharacterized protein (TIGR03437 family)